MLLPPLLSKRNYGINLLGFFAACFVMWFGVFILHIYDATGPEQPIGAIVLLFDWLVIAYYGFTILYITLRRRKEPEYQTLAIATKTTGTLASILVVFGIAALAIVIVFYILMAVAFSHWSF